MLGGRRALRDFLLGTIVGVANMVPGISGGTILFISGRYSEVVGALSRFFSFKITKKDLLILVNLAAGVAASFLLLSKLMDFLFENYPIKVLSFFSGLIIGGLLFMYPKVRRVSMRSSLSMAAGALLIVFIYLYSSGSLDPSLLNLTLGGVLAGGAMILPGISGSSILVILGLYDDAIHALSNFQLLKLVFLGIGAAIGVVVISILFKSFLEKYERETMSFLYGLTLSGLIFIMAGGVDVSFIIFGLGTSFLVERYLSEEES